MNVVVIGNFPYPFGMAGTKRVQHFIDFLVKYGVTLSVLLLRQGGAEIANDDREGTFKGVDYKTVGNDLKLNSTILFALSGYIWQGCWSLVTWKKSNTKNILYCYGGPDIENILFIILGKIIGYKVVFDIVEDYSVFEGRVKFPTKVKVKTLLFLQKYIRLISDGIIVISLNLLKKYETMTRGKVVRLIPISAQVKTYVRKTCYGSPVKIVYSGSFATKDGVDNLIEAFSNVHSRGRNATLYLTGKGNRENLDRIKQRIANCEAIRYLGYLEDEEFYEFINGADIMCMTRQESNFAHAGFPFKLGEYLATGNPVIASNTGDVDKYLRNMEDALLVAPGNVQEIEKVLDYLLDNPQLALKIGLSGRRRCQECFDPDKNGQLLLDMFCKI